MDSLTKTVFLPLLAVGAFFLLSSCSGGSTAPATVNPVLTPNPTPSIGSLTPSTVIGSGPALSMQVNGADFLTNSIVQWGGENRPTTFSSGTELNVQLAATDVMVARTVQVTVVNPSPGGGISNAVSFVIKRTGLGALALANLATAAGQTIQLLSSNTKFTARDVALSATGRYIGFSRAAPGQPDDIYVRDTCVGADPSCQPSTVLVGVTVDGNPPDGQLTNAVISSDGRFVTFLADARNLTNESYAPIVPIPAAYLRDTCIGVSTGCTPATTRVSVASDGTPANDHTVDVAISPDGRNVGFSSYANNLTPADVNNNADVFVRDTCAGVLVSCTPSTILASLGDDGSQEIRADTPALSVTGRYVTFNAIDPKISPQQLYQEVFARDTCLGAGTSCIPHTLLVSSDIDGSPAQLGAWAVSSVSSDGRFIPFSSFSQNIADNRCPPIPNFPADQCVQSIYVKDTCIGSTSGCTPTVTRVSVATDGTPGNDSSDGGTISADGRFVSFVSIATNLVPGGSHADPNNPLNSRQDVFVRDTCVNAPAGCLPRTMRVSVAGDGTLPNGDSFGPRISADGHLVVFWSYASNLIPGLTVTPPALYVAQGLPSQ